MREGCPEPIAALNRVEIIETGEPLVDIRDFCPGVVIMDRVCPYLRHSVAEMLNRAASLLTPDYKLRVGTALRTFSMQKGNWDGYFRKMQEEHPNWPLSTLRRATNRYHAPYDQPAPPGHCTGGAVDVAILRADGEPLDVTSPTEGWQAAYTWSNRISSEARQNRMLMVEAMLAAGFSNCREEYWHYSWGDSAWAVRVGETTCPYGMVEAPVVVETRFEGGEAEDLRQIGEYSWSFRPVVDSGVPRFLVGVFWAEGKEVELQITELLPETLYTSLDRENWELLPFRRQGGALVMEVTPTTPRIYISSHLSSNEAPPEATLPSMVN
jgi:zinc D-Ala-D-Ala dipeptidase